MLDLALRTSAILLAAWGACVMLQRASAATRHLVLHAAVVAVLLAPLLLPVTPTFDVPLLPAVRDGFARIAPPVADSTRPWRGPYSATAPTPDPASPDRSVPLRPAVPNLSWASVALIVWVTGFALCAICFAAGWIRAARIVRRASPVEPGWHIELNDVCARLQIRSEVRLLLVSGTAAPS